METQTSVQEEGRVATAKEDIAGEPLSPHHRPVHLHHLPHTRILQLQRDPAQPPLLIEGNWVAHHISSVEKSKDKLTQSMDRPT